MKNSLEKLVENAVDAYSMWHQKPHKKVKELSVEWPKTIHCFGRAEQIIYKSDKWEKDNDFYTYDHIFDSRPNVYCGPDSSFFQFAETKSRKLAPLLSVKDLEKDTIAAPYLAKTLEFTFCAHDGSYKRITFNNSPSLCCTVDKKTLIICSTDGFLFVHGGAMRVTSRGIVK